MNYATHLIWAFDRTFEKYPVMAAELLRDAACSAGYHNILCSQRDLPAVNCFFEALDISRLYEGSYYEDEIRNFAETHHSAVSDFLFEKVLASIDQIENFISEHHLKASDLYVICDSEAAIPAAQCAGITVLLFDPDHCFNHVQNVPCVNSFAGLREMLSI